MKPRPTSVTVIAIFHFILGGLGLLLGLFTLAGAVMAYSTTANASPSGGPSGLFTAQAHYAYMNAHNPYWKEVALAMGVIGLALSGLMIAAGVACLQMKPAGRTMSLIYAVASLIFQVATFIYSIFVTIPATAAFYDSLAGTGPGTGMPNFAASMKSGLYVGMSASLVGLIFPVLVLIFMLQPRIAAAFRGEWNRPDDYGYGPGGAGRVDDRGGYPAGYDQPPPGYGGEPDDRIGPAR